MLQHLSLALVASLAAPSLADGQFKSRPDLSPPRLNVTIPASSDIGDGYIFVGPYSGFTKGLGLDGPEQQAGYILRNNGDLVWSSLGHLSGWVGNMQVSSLGGKPVLSVFEGTLDAYHGHGFGHPTVLNEKYERLHHIRGGNHKIISIHEFNLLDAGSAMIEVYQPKQVDLSEFGGNKSHSWIVDGIFQELDVRTNELRFEWHSLDHVSPEASAVALSSGHAGDGQNSTSAWDYFHINSVDKNENGDYLISARHASALYKINGKTGEIMWQLGGRGSDFTYSDDVLFGFQHDARFWTSDESEADVEYVSLFDNAARANGHRGGGVEIVHSKSRAKVIRLNKKAWKATAEISLTAPGDILAPSQGNVQRLHNGNLFVNWGQGGAVTEYRHGDYEVIFHALLDSGELGEGVQSYRGFRFPWHGYPSESPAIVAQTSPLGETSIYVSWNGDTETVKWEIYAMKASCASTVGKRFCRPMKLGISERLSFETVFHLDQSNQYIREKLVFFAQALDRDGNVLVVSEKVQAESPYHGSFSHDNESVDRQIEL